MKNKKLTISIIITLLYGIITLISVLHHEIWADEAQVWMLCKNLSIPQLINHLHNEGHPSFFYLLVMPFAKIFSNIIYMQLICWFTMCCAVFLLIYKSPFNLIIKLSVLISAGFIYFLPVMARSYSILPFLIFLAVLLYLKRKEHPILYASILFCIANTHIMMFGFAGILSLFYIIECIKEKNLKKLQLISISIMIFGILAVILQLHNTTSSNVFINFSFNNIIFNIIRVITLFFINSYNYEISMKNSFIFPIIDIPIICGIFISFILLLINLFFNNKKLFLIAFIGIGFQFAIYILAYNSFIYVTRIFIAYIILLGCFWILYKENKFNNKYKICKKNVSTFFLTCLFLLTTYNGINYYLSDLKYDYAGAKKAAEFIQKNIDKDSLLLIDNEPYMVSLVYYLQDSHNLFSPYRNKNIKYVVWDPLTIVNTIAQQWIYYIKTNNFQTTKKDIYIIRSNSEENFYSIEKDNNKNFHKIYSTKYIIEGLEGYIIYKYIE